MHVPAMVDWACCCPSHFPETYTLRFLNHCRRISRSDLDSLLRHGMRWTEERGLSWPEDREVNLRGNFQGKF